MIFEFGKTLRDRANNPRERYSRQAVFSEIGEDGQEKINQGKVLIAGCGALGCNIANLLVRAGVGKVKIVDRDFIEFHNLQRQVLFDEDDVRKQLPKAIAAKRHLDPVNSLIEIEPAVADINFTNAEALCNGMDVIVDGLDNMESRFLLNEVSQKLKIPYIYGGAVASTGMTATFIPGKTACLRCISSHVPAKENSISCETTGIIGSIPAVIGAMEATEVLKILTGSDAVNQDLITLDIWNLSHEHVKLSRKDDCPACKGKFEFLNAKHDELITTSLCGQSRAVQVVNTKIKKLNLHELAITLPDASNIFQNEYMLRFDSENYGITVFTDGRAIIKNTTDESLAKILYQRYIRSNEE